MIMLLAESRGVFAYRVFWEGVRGGGFWLGLWRRVYRGDGGAGGISVVKYLSSQSPLGTGRWL